jgi:hypothetical protein
VVARKMARHLKMDAPPLHDPAAVKDFVASNMERMASPKRTEAVLMRKSSKCPDAPHLAAPQRAVRRCAGALAPIRSRRLP